MGNNKWYWITEKGKVHEIPWKDFSKFQKKYVYGERRDTIGTRLFVTLWGDEVHLVKGKNSFTLTGGQTAALRSLLKKGEDDGKK